MHEHEHAREHVWLLQASAAGPPASPGSGVVGRMVRKLSFSKSKSSKSKRDVWDDV